MCDELQIQLNQAEDKLNESKQSNFHFFFGFRTKINFNLMYRI